MKREINLSPPAWALAELLADSQGVMISTLFELMIQGTWEGYQRDQQDQKEKLEPPAAIG